jgi:DnaJ-class molecular chaperone
MAHKIIGDPSRCPRCHGTGFTMERIYTGRPPVNMHCVACRKYCLNCLRWVETVGHKCRGARRLERNRAEL